LGIIYSIKQKIFKGITMKMIWLLGGFNSAQTPLYNGIVIPAEAGIHILKFSFLGVGKICP